jgi:hypothetical protein
VKRTDWATFCKGAFHAPYLVFSFNVTAADSYVLPSIRTTILNEPSWKTFSFSFPRIFQSQTGLGGGCGQAIHDQ